MDIQQAIEHTKNKKGMKLCLPGLLNNSGEELNRLSKVLKNKGAEYDVDYAAGYAFSLKEVSKHYNQAREAWLKGDLETVAEFFGLYVGSKL